MAPISPPSWAKNAIPTLNGWKDPRTNELLKSQNLTQEEVDAYSGVVEQHVIKNHQGRRLHLCLSQYN